MKHKVSGAEFKEKVEKQVEKLELDLFYDDVWREYRRDMHKRMKKTGIISWGKWHSGPPETAYTPEKIERIKKEIEELEFYVIFIDVEKDYDIPFHRLKRFGF